MTNKKIELADEKLEKVSGGGSGHATNGIFGVTYDMPETNRYYSSSSEVKTNDKVLYCDELDGRGVNVRIEYFYVDNDNNWHTKYFYSNYYRTVDEFKKNYPYVLNIRP